MTNTPIKVNPIDSNIGSLIVLFRTPSRRLLIRKPLCDQYGSVIDLKINGLRYFVNEAPMVVQPDLLVDEYNRRIIGFTFRLASPSWMLSRCEEMLRGLDSRSIRISSDNSENSLEVIWSEIKSDKKVVFAQLDFGLWGFLYAMQRPNMLRDSDAWTSPEGLVIGDLSQLTLPISVAPSELGDTIIEPVLLNSE